MHALDVISRAPEIEVYTPERGAESVGQTRPALVVEGVRFAEDEGEVGLEFVWEGGEEMGLVELFGDGDDGACVVHKSALKSYARDGGAAYVAMKSLDSGCDVAG